MKKLFLLVVAVVLGVLAWLRLRPTEELPPIGSDAEAPSPLGELGGDIDPELLSILACPLDKQPVTREGNYIVCSQCGRQYPIRDGIPVMLIDEAILPERPPAAAQPHSAEPGPSVEQPEAADAAPWSATATDAVSVEPAAAQEPAPGEVKASKQNAEGSEQ